MFLNVKSQKFEKIECKIEGQDTMPLYDKYDELSANQFVTKMQIQKKRLDGKKSKEKLIEVIFNDYKIILKKDIEKTFLHEEIEYYCYQNNKKNKITNRSFAAISKDNFFNCYINTIVYDVKLIKLKKRIYAKEKNYSKIANNYFEDYKLILEKIFHIENIFFNKQDTLLTSLNKIKTDIEKNKLYMPHKLQLRCAALQTILNFEYHKSLHNKTYSTNKNSSILIDHCNIIKNESVSSDYLINFNLKFKNLRIEILDKNNDIVYNEDFSDLGNNFVFHQFIKKEDNKKKIDLLDFYFKSGDNASIITKTNSNNNSYDVYDTEPGNYFFKVNLERASYIYIFLYSPNNEDSNNNLFLIYPFEESEHKQLEAGEQTMCEQYNINFKKTKEGYDEAFIKIIISEQKIKNIFDISEKKKINNYEVIKINIENCSTLNKQVDAISESIKSKTIIFKFQ